MRVASAGLVYWVARFFLLGTKARILGLTVEVQLSWPLGEGSLPRREDGEKEDGAVGRVAASPECPRPTPPNPWLYHIQQRGFASGIKNLQKGGLSRIIQMSPQVITGYLHMVNLPRFFALSVTARSQEASLSSCWAGLDLLLQSGITGVTFPSVPTRTVPAPSVPAPSVPSPHDASHWPSGHLKGV